MRKFRQFGRGLVVLILCGVFLISYGLAAFSQEDTTPPVISSPAPTTLLNSASPVLEAVVTDDVYVDGDSATLAIDNGPFLNGLTYDRATQKLTLQWPLPLPEGQHTAHLTVKDQAGNAASLDWNFTTDTLPPLITGGAPAEGANQVFTTNTLPYYYFYVNDTNKVQSFKFTLDGIPVASANLINWGNGQLVYSGSQNIKDGTYQARLELQDFAGNQTVRNWTIQVQGTPTITPETPNGIITTSTPVIKVRITDFSTVDPNSVTISLDGGPEINAAAYFNKAPYYNYLYYPVTTPLAPVNHTVTVKAKCLNGHESIRTWQFGYDLVPPVVQSTSLLYYPTLNSPNFIFAEGATLDKGSDLTIACTISESLRLAIVKLDGVQVYYSANNYPNYSGSLQTAPQMISLSKRTLADGPHQLEVTAVDFGNNQANFIRNFTVAEAPKLTAENPPNLAKLPAPTIFYGQITDLRTQAILTTTRPTITAKITDGNNGLTKSNISFKIDGQTQPFSYEPTTGVLTFLPAQELTDEMVHEIAIEAKDPAGNMTSSNWQFYINTYPDMPWNSNKTCVTCHADNRAIHLPRTPEEQAKYGTDCKSCHGGYELTYNLRTLEQRCIACHKYQWHIVAEPKGPYHEVAFNDVTGIPTVTLDTAHRASSVGCTPCHAKSINREHQQAGRTDDNGKPITCDTCHLSSKPAVQQAIANQQKDCAACHTLGSGDHESMHVTTLDANCTKVCHQASLTQEHLNNALTQTKTLNCDTCHSSTNPQHIAAIATNRINCANCHTSAHQVLLNNLPDQDIPLLTSLTWTNPISGGIFKGEIPSALENGYVLISSSSTTLNGQAVLDYYQTQMLSSGWVLTSSPAPVTLERFEITFTKGTRQALVRYQPVASQLHRLTIVYN